MSFVRKGGSFFLFRVIMPGGWFLATVAGTVYKWPDLLAFYEWQPLVAGNFAALWFLIGLAFVPMSLRHYQVAAVAIILFATVFNVVIGQIPLTKDVLTLGGASLLAFLAIWLGAFGTTWWKFAQGRLAVDSEDEDT